jgi:hypothetical protein
VVSGSPTTTATIVCATAMDPWKELAAREECRDAIRAWAELEGKSPLMVEDLTQRYTPLPPRKFEWRLAFGFGVKLLVWLYESWWHITRR